MAPVATMLSLASIAKTAKRELTGRKLAFNLFFYSYHVGLFAYGWWKQQGDQRLALLNTLKFSVWFSRGAGLVLGTDCALILLPVLRNAIVYLRPVVATWIPLDESIYFHRMTAYSLLFFTIVHTTAHYINFIVVEQVQARPGDTAVLIHYAMPGGLTGHIMLLIMLLMYTTANKKIRIGKFEVFWYTHHLSFLFLLCVYTHATGCFVRGALPGQPVQCLGYYTWRFSIFGGIFYFCERVWREIRSRRNTSLIGVLMHPSGCMELRFQKPSMKYKSGQWLFLQVPDVSHWQWHPFTISSSPEDPYISVQIRQAGDWTKALGSRLGCTPELASELTGMAKKGEKQLEVYGQGGFIDMSSQTPPGFALPKIRIDGPYGAPAEDALDQEILLLISTGVGVTPMASILKTIAYRAKAKKLGVLRRVVFIWVNRDASAFEWFGSLLRDVEDKIADRELISIQTYLTSRLTEDQIAQVIVHNGAREGDVMTNLHRSQTHFGKPDWNIIFRSIQKGIEDGSFRLPGLESQLKTTVSCFFCGPNPLARVLQEKSEQYSNKDVQFNFRKEHF